MKRLKICAALLALILALECGYCVAAFTNWVPPLSRLRDTFIETALGTMEHKWLATVLFPADIVEAVRAGLEADRLAQEGQNSSLWETDETPTERDFFELFPEIDPADFRAFAPVATEELDEFYVNYAGLDEVGLDLRTRQGDQILAIDAANGLMVIRIKGSTYKGVLVIGKDPSRLKCAPAPQWGTIGDRAGNIAEANNGLVAMTGSGFGDAKNVAEGADQAGGAMFSGVAKGRHYPWGYKRVELHLDNRLYITDANSAYSADCTDATEWTPALIVDGKLVVLEDNGGYTALNPRACIGQTRDESIMFLGIEGRNIDSLGCDAVECARVLERYGAYQAMNVDGGTSAIVWYQGEYIMKCSNEDLPEGRRLPNAWVYCANTVPDPEL